MNEIKLGNQVRDIVSGFEGIATSRVEYLNGCVQYCVQPKSKDGTRPASEYIDYQQLEVIGAGIAVDQRAVGGPSRDQPSGTYRG